MKFRLGKKLLVYCVSPIFLITAAGNFAEGQANHLLRKYLVWPQAESEITDVQFSRDGNFIVLVSRVHWPDGAEAEGLPESFFRKLEQRKQRDPRFADPVVKLIDLKGNLICEAGYGTHPDVSPDNKSIVFSRQKRPISGLRPLAETLAGNDIQVFDCEKKQVRTVAQPDAGYLDTPFFVAGGKSVVYTQNDAVNGVMGGPVAVAMADLADGHDKVLLARSSTPSVPCPPAGSPRSDPQAFMCAQPAKLTTSFPDLVLGFAPMNNQTFVLVGKPVPAPGDMYLAKRYAIRLISVFPRTEELLSIEKTDIDDPWQVSLQPLSSDKVMMFLKYWKPFSVQTKSWLPDAGPRNVNPKSIYSPDMKYYLAEEPTDEPNHLTIYRVADGERVAMLPRMASIFEATWSPDSKRLAIVVSPTRTTNSAYREDLVVFSAP